MIATDSIYINSKFLHEPQLFISSPVFFSRIKFAKCYFFALY